MPTILFHPGIGFSVSLVNLLFSSGTAHMLTRNLIRSAPQNPTVAAMTLSLQLWKARLKGICLPVLMRAITHATGPVDITNARTMKYRHTCQILPFIIFRFCEALGLLVRGTLYFLTYSTTRPHKYCHAPIGLRRTNCSICQERLV